MPLSFPEVYPRVARLLGDNAGRLWVMRFPELTTSLANTDLFNYTPPLGSPPGPQLWRALTPSGDVLGELEAPDGLQILEIGEDYLLGLTIDEFDVLAAKHGMQGKDGFALWGWWRKPKIYLRARSLKLFPHEARHIETKSNFHE